MPFVVIDGIVIDSLRRAKALSAVRAPHEHYVGAVGGTGRFNARQHINVVVGGGAGTVYRQKQLSRKSSWIY